MTRYEEVEQSDGSVRVKQHHHSGRVRWVTKDHKGYKDAKDVTLIPYTAPKVEKEVVDPEAEAKHLLSHTDAKMIRVLDDLIEVLIEKCIIGESDLPNEVMSKLVARKNLRNSIKEK